MNISQSLHKGYFNSMENHVIFNKLIGYFSKLQKRKVYRELYNTKITRLCKELLKYINKRNFLSQFNFLAIFELKISLIVPFLLTLSHSLFAIAQIICVFQL